MSLAIRGLRQRILPAFYGANVSRFQLGCGCSNGRSKTTTSGSSGDAAKSAEESMAALLTSKLEATEVVVNDISGGCGSMYSAFVASPHFKGIGLVKQHKLVKEVLKSEIAEMHGITIKTKISE